MSVVFCDSSPSWLRPVTLGGSTQHCLLLHQLIHHLLPSGASSVFFVISLKSQKWNFYISSILNILGSLYMFSLYFSSAIYHLFSKHIFLYSGLHYHHHSDVYHFTLFQKNVSACTFCQKPSWILKDRKNKVTAVVYPSFSETMLLIYVIAYV